MNSVGRFLHYAFWTLAALIGIAASEALLQSGHTVYLHFDRSVFAQQAWVLGLIMGLAGALGATLDRPGMPAWASKLPRFLLLMLLCVALFQIARRSPDANWTSQRWAKAAALVACAALAAGAACWLSGPRAHRLAGALGLVCLTVFALQPGMMPWLLTGSPVATPAAAPTEAPAKLAERRVVVLLLDELDEELAEREGFFDRPELQPVLRSSYRNMAMRPAGPSTLTSVPGMLRGRAYGKVDYGGVGFLVSQGGERFDASDAGLFRDMNQAGLAYGVVGFYHDYCRLAPDARRCVVEPMRFFPGWWAALTRPVKAAQDLQDNHSSFLLNWRNTYARLHREALAAAADPTLQMAWLHVNVPHPPSAVEAPTADLLTDYRRNLGVAAQLVSEVRGRLAAQSQPSALVVISDHWMREKELWGPMYARQLGTAHAHAGKSADQRVPLLVWFSDAPDGGLVDRQPHDATLVRQLVNDLLLGRVRSPAQVASALSDGAVVH